mgnify:CR=1 FL=1
MTGRLAISGARIFDGSAWHERKSLVIGAGKVKRIVPAGSEPDDARICPAVGRMIVPGFVDLQVNGGGGVLLNEDPSVDAIRTICAAHAQFGTTALLPTLITDTPEVTRRALSAGRGAAEDGVPGFLGLHLEGPHISVARKGAHDPSLIRPMEEADLDRLVSARPILPVLMTTVAPENTTADQVAKLARAGLLVSLGHTDTDYATAVAYAGAGARLATHLFNAMSPLSHRAPGMVGAALQTGALWVGLIADGHHVDPAAIAIALRAKMEPGRIFLVTDAMSTVGTSLQSFELNGRTIYRREGRLTLADGTLAGSDIDMIASVRFMHRSVGVAIEEALRMAALYPAEAAGIGDRKGRLSAGFDADFIELSDRLEVEATWIGGTKVHARAA